MATILASAAGASGVAVPIVAYYTSLKAVGLSAMQEMSGEKIPSVSNTYRLGDRRAILAATAVAVVLSVAATLALDVGRNAKLCLGIGTVYALCALGAMTYVYWCKETKAANIADERCISDQAAQHVKHVMCWGSALAVMTAISIGSFIYFRTEVSSDIRKAWNWVIGCLLFLTVSVFGTWLLPPKWLFNGILFAPCELLTIVANSFTLFFVSHVK